MQQSIGVGIIGGGFGARVVAPCFQAAAPFRVVAFSARSLDKYREAMSSYGQIAYLQSWQDMLSLQEVQLICVATPPFLHAEMATKVLDAGKHLLCEKPLAMDMGGAVAVKQAASRANGISMIDHQLRFHPNLRKIKRLIDQETLGPVRHVQLHYQTSVRINPELPWDWWSDSKSGGGELNAIGSHMIDLLCWWFGKVDRVQGILNTYTHERPLPEGRGMKPVTTDDSVLFHMTFTNQVTVSVVLSAASWCTPSIRIGVSGQFGYLEMEGFDQLRLFNQKGISDLSEIDPLRGLPVVGENPWRTSLVRLAEHFSRCIQEGHQVEGATVDDGYNTQEVLEAIRCSAFEGTSISLSVFRSRDLDQKGYDV